MEVPAVDKLIEFIKKCPYDKYSISPTGITRNSNYYSVLHVYINKYKASNPVYEIILNGVDVTEYYTEVEHLKLKEALQEANNKYKEYLINTFIFEDLNPVLETYNVKDFDGFV